MGLSDPLQKYWHNLSLFGLLDSVVEPTVSTSARGYRGCPGRFEKHSVWVWHRKTGNILESRVKRSRRPMRCLEAGLSGLTVSAFGGGRDWSIETPKDHGALSHARCAVRMFLAIYTG